MMVQLPNQHFIPACPDHLHENCRCAVCSTGTQTDAPRWGQSSSIGRLLGTEIIVPKRSEGPGMILSTPSPTRGSMNTNSYSILYQPQQAGTTLIRAKIPSFCIGGIGRLAQHRGGA